MTTSIPTVLKTENQGTQRLWRHYFIVDDHKVTLVEMLPAVLGWNVRKIETAPISRDWPDMSAADVVAWKRRFHDVAIVDGDERRCLLELVQAKGGV